MPTPKTRKPRPSANRDTASKENQHNHITRIVREIAAILAIGAMTGVMFWQSVFGMVDSFTSGPVVEIVGSMAMEAQDYGR